MTELIDKPIYSTGDIAYILKTKTAFVRNTLHNLESWSENEIPVETINDRKVASYRQCVFVDILLFLRSEKLHWSKARTVILQRQKDDSFFVDQKWHLATDGVVGLAKHKDHEQPVELGTNQFAMQDVLEPSLEWREFEAIMKGRLKFSNKSKVAAWRPDPEFPEILVHPAVGFGKPHLHGRMIKSETLFDMYKDENDLDRLACEFDLEKDQVSDAIRFEQSRRNSPDKMVH